MKISFDTPLKYTDGSAIPAAALAAASYIVFIDTVSPPVAKFPVPAANIAAATLNTDGTKHVIVDSVTDLKASLTAGTKYYVSLEDSVGGTLSAMTGILTYTYAPVPEAPGNPTVA